MEASSDPLGAGDPLGVTGPWVNAEAEAKKAAAKAAAATAAAAAASAAAARQSSAVASASSAGPLSSAGGPSLRALDWDPLTGDPLGGPTIHRSETAPSVLGAGTGAGYGGKRQAALPENPHATFSMEGGVGAPRLQSVSQGAQQHQQHQQSGRDDFGERHIVKVPPPVPKAPAKCALMSRISVHPAHSISRCRWSTDRSISSPRRPRTRRGDVAVRELLRVTSETTRRGSPLTCPPLRVPSAHATAVSVVRRSSPHSTGIPERGSHARRFSHVFTQFSLPLEQVRLSGARGAAPHGAPPAPHQAGPQHARGRDGHEAVFSGANLHAGTLAGRHGW